MRSPVLAIPDRPRRAARGRWLLPAAVGLSFVVACSADRQAPPAKSRGWPRTADTALPAPRLAAEGGGRERDAAAESAAPAVEGILFEWPAGLETRGSRFWPTVAVTADGSRVAATIAKQGRGGIVVIWDGATGREIRRLDVDAETLEYAADGSLVMVANKALQVLPSGDDSPLRKVQPSEGIARVSPNGAWIVTYGRSWPPDLLAVSREGRSQVLLTGDRHRFVNAIAFAPDDSRVCVVSTGGSGDMPDGTARAVVFDLVGGRWRRGAAYDVGPARQDHSALFLSRERAWIDERVFELPSGRARPAPRATYPGRFAPGGRVVLFDDHTGLRHLAAVIVDGEATRWTDVRRPRVMGGGQAEAISERGAVVWCTSTACSFGPAVLE